MNSQLIKLPKPARPSMRQLKIRLKIRIRNAAVSIIELLQGWLRALLYVIDPPWWKTGERADFYSATPCCGKPMSVLHEDGPRACVEWNPWNRVMQCHRCSAIYVPDPDTDLGVLESDDANDADEPPT